MNHNKKILCLVFALFVALGMQAFGQITPLADSYTNTAASTTNYGANVLLDVDGATQISYIQFNLSSIPSTASISQATLKLYVNTVPKAGTFNVDYVNGAWVESTIDASNAPPLGSTIASNVNVTTADKNQYILVNVTSAVQAWLNGSEANNGLALVADGSFDATFDSKENTTTSHPPELDIAFAGGDGTITGVTTGSSSGLTGGGTSGTLNVSLLTSCASNQVLQWSGSAWKCASAGTGTITGVTAGTDLTGGGTSGNVTLSLNTSALNSSYAQLSANNTLAGTQTVNGEVSIFTGVAQNPLFAFTATGSDSGQVAISPSLAVADYNGIVQAGDQAITYTSALDITPWADATSGMRINSNGSVGIGVALPQAALDVQGVTGEEAGYFSSNLDYYSTVYAINEVASSDTAAAIYAGNSEGNYCQVNQNGELYCTGTKSAVVRIDGDSRKVALYAVEAPENWFEDYGSGQLSGGSARVTLEPTFAQTVNTNLDYHVFLTPRGDCKGLYVTNLTPTGFEVRELQQGSSAVAFDYRIIAKRRNYESVRLADFTERDRKMQEHLATMRQRRKAGAATHSAPVSKLENHPALQPVKAK